MLLFEKPNLGPRQDCRQLFLERDSQKSVLLVDLLYKVSVESTIENLCLGQGVLAHRGLIMLVHMQLIAFLLQLLRPPHQLFCGRGHLLKHPKSSLI